MVAFDLTDEGSLLNAPKWMQEASENADDPVKFLIGTKRDLLVKGHEMLFGSYA